MYLLRRGGAAANDRRSWERRPIPAEGVALVACDDGVEIRAGRDARAAAHVVPFLENERRQAALVAQRSVGALFVGGSPPLPVSVLDERAEIVLDGVRLYFTAREPLSVAPYTGDPDDCGLCGDSLEGAQVIHCTGCGAVTHEGALPGGEERLCFTHLGRCPRCRLTRADFAWTPEEGD